MQTTTQPTPVSILQIGTGFWASKVLLTAVQFELFTQLPKQPNQSATDIKSLLGFKCTDRNVYDFLDCLAGLGFLKREGLLETAQYSNTLDTDTFLDKAKPFNIRVAIVEPGIINTQMANNISVDEKSIYPNSKRLAGLFSASLKNPTAPTLVADKILEIAESDTWKSRHPVDPDAQPFIAWRASMTDEEWVDWNAINDDEWYESVQNTFGLDAR